LLSAMADDLLSDGDPWRAMRRLMQQGARMPEGGRMPGLRDLLERLKRQRQERLQRYDLGSSLDDIKKKLDEVMLTERDRIKQTPDAHQRAGQEKKLDAIPKDPAGQLRDLQTYDFVSPEAKQKFEELLSSLRQNMMQPSMQSLMQSLSPEQRKQLDDMMRSVMLQDERLEAQMRQLAMNLAEFLPLDEMAQRYPFQGDQEMSLQEAMRLMEEMQQMDELERELRGIRNLKDLDRVEPDKVEQLLGPEA